LGRQYDWNAKPVYDREVKRRAPKWGESWILPLGLPREGGPLVAPTFDDAAAEEDAGEAAAVVKAATPDAGPALDEAAAFVYELGAYDEAEAFMASIIA